MISLIKGIDLNSIIFHMKMNRISRDVIGIVSFLMILDVYMRILRRHYKISNK